MLAKIGEIVRQVALITMLAAFLEMLLPERKMTAYVRLVLGLFIVVAILTPIVEFLRYGPDLDVAAWDLRFNGEATTALQQGLELAADNENAALQVYRDRLAGQIKSLVILTPEVKTAEVLVEVAAEQGCRGTIERVAVVVSLKEPEKVKKGGEASLIEVERVKIEADMENEKQSLPNADRDIKQGQDEIESLLPKDQVIRENGPVPESKDPAAEAVKFTATQIQQIKSRIVATIAHFYSLDPGKVEVQVLP